ncbi:MAG: DUF2971 domain-containing protein [Bacteroidales bacterium]|nr:DUF2971 domain-containing protein [Bacteroidales bacterium]
MLFSQQTNTNDIFERRKFIVGDLQHSSITNIDVNCLVSQIFNEIKSYKQVCLCKDYPDGTKGYASPMMWGQYARSKENDIWIDGVCIELDTSKMVIESGSHFERIVKYSEKLDNIHLKGYDFKQDNSIAKFVKYNKDALFFSKHKHWEHESEYRIVSKHDKVIDISNAITGVYVLDMESETFNVVFKLVKDPSLIYFMLKGGSVWGLSRYNYGKYLSFQDK